MRYDNNYLRDLLSAEYVLGKLKGPARARFERLCQDKADYEQSMLWWQDKLHLLADTAPAVNPKGRVWKNIEARLFANESMVNISSAVRWWRNLALTTSALSLALAVFITTELLTRSPDIQYAAPKPIPTTIATLVNEQAQTGWVLSFSRNTKGKAEIKALSLSSLEKVSDMSFELWVLPANQSAPISLGLLPQDGSTNLVVDESIIYAMTSGSLAVSLEPLGGSPGDLPTGPVLYQGKLAQI